MPGATSRRPISAYYWLLAGILLQGFSPVLTKLLLGEGLSQASVVAWRYGLAVLCFLPLAPWSPRSRPDRPPRRRDWVALILVGFLGSGLGALLFTWALTFSNAGVVNALSKTAPIFVVALAYLALQEQVTLPRLALVAAMVVADLILGAGDLAGGGALARQRLLGDGLALGAGLCRAVAEILAKGTLRRFSPGVLTFSRVGIGALFGLAVLLPSGHVGDILHLSTGGWAVLVGLAVVSTVGSMHLYYEGLMGVPVHVAQALRLLSVVVTVVVSWMWLGEALNLLHLVGVVLLLAGAHLLILRTPARRAPVPPAPVAEPPARPGPERLRRRLTLTAAAVLVGVVAPATYLMARHATDLVRRETELAMSNVAATVLESVAAQPQAPPSATERFLEQVVTAKISNASYSVDVVFAVLQDPQGSVLALAYEPGFLPGLAPGALRPPRGEIATRLLALARDPGLAATQGMVVVQASLEGGERPVQVTLGCLRQAAGRLVGQIVARHVALGLLIVFTGLALLWVTLGKALRPLEELLRAVEQVSCGRRDYPVLAGRGPEVKELAVAVDEMRLALARGDQWQQVAPGLLLQVSAERAASLAGAVVLGIPRPGLQAATGEARQAALGAVLEQEGHWEGWYGDLLLASWGSARGEQDDAVRALLAGLEAARALAGERGESPLLADAPEVLAQGYAARGETRPPTPGHAGLSGSKPSAAVWTATEGMPLLEELVAAGELMVVEERRLAQRWLLLTGGAQESGGDAPAPHWP